MQSKTWCERPPGIPQQPSWIAIAIQMGRCRLGIWIAVATQDWRTDGPSDRPYFSARRLASLAVELDQVADVDADVGGPARRQNGHVLNLLPYVAPTGVD